MIEEAYDGNLDLKIKNLSQVAVGCLKLSVHKNGTEGFHVKVAEQNYELPIHSLRCVKMLQVALWTHY